MRFKELANQYTRSPMWTYLAYNTKQNYSNSIKNLIYFHDHKVDDITRPMLLEFMDRNSGSPGMVREAIKAMRNIMNFGFDRGLVKVNPAVGLKVKPSKPIDRWSRDEFEHFVKEASLPLSRVAIFALYTGQRRSDLIKMQWFHVSENFIFVTQQKTGKAITIPIHPKLRPYTHENYRVSNFILTNAYGDKWHPNSLSTSVRRHAKKIGLENKSIHGLRKSCASILAESGCTSHEIAAITGQSLKEVEHYTKEVDQVRLANSAMEKWS